MEDLLSDPSDDNVSDVDPEELQKMLEVKKYVEFHTGAKINFLSRN